MTPRAFVRSDTQLKLPSFIISPVVYINLIKPNLDRLEGTQLLLALSSRSKGDFP